MQKVLLDTSIILDDTNNLVYLHTQGKELYISDIVLEELDRKKDSQSESGYFAREFFRCVNNVAGHDYDDYLDFNPIDVQNSFQEREREFINSDEIKGRGLKKNWAIESKNENLDSYTILVDDSGFKALPSSVKNHPTILARLESNLSSTKPLQPLDSNDFITTLECCVQDVCVPIFVITRKHYKTQFMDYGYNDARIREIARDYDLVLLTNDIALRVRSITDNIESYSLKRGQISNPKEIHFISPAVLRRDLSDKEAFEDSKDFRDKSNWHIFEISECDYTDSSRYFTGKKYFGIKNNESLEMLDIDSIIKEYKPYILPLNIEQKLAYALLLHPQNCLSIITGSTGSGKTLMALQAGITLQKQGKVDGIIYLRNTVTANDKEAELGFRKGDENQKLHYFMYPLFSGINFIIEGLKEGSIAKRIEYRGDSKGYDKQEATYYFLQKHNIEMLDIAHARGISLHNKFVIFDEVQNASDATIKLIGTRMGENSKIVFLGDYNQIDHPYLSKTRNGALSLLNKARSDDFVCGLQFKHTIRSRLAKYFDEGF